MAWTFVELTCPDLLLRTADPVSSTFDGVNFTNAKFGDAWFHRASGKVAVADGADLRDAQFRRTSCYPARLCVGFVESPPYPRR